MGNTHLPKLQVLPSFQPFDLSLPDESRLLMEFEHLSLLHVKHGSDFVKIWSNDRLDGGMNYKIRKFMKNEFY